MKVHMTILAITAALAAGLIAAKDVSPTKSLRSHASEMTVHEWGTFTSCQDAGGQDIGGINSDDEPVPPFVHDLIPGLIRWKGLPPELAAATMRLETPVLYFYPPAHSQPEVENVSVKFIGGWLSQYYPGAIAVAPGVSFYKNYIPVIGQLTSHTIGSLTWKNVLVGVPPGGPLTNDPVWTCPRQVHAAYVRAADGEVERFLFYRGVGHVSSPLSVVRSNHGLGADLTVRVAARYEQMRLVRHIRRMWLCDFRGDGAVAFRSLGNVSPVGHGDGRLASFSDDFSPRDYSFANLQMLRASMHAALVADGLYPDEATAMLNTWKRSYFKAYGERLFFIVPRAWTNHYLPLQIVPPARITRVMMGRIELITPEQKAIAIALAKLKPGDPGLEHNLPAELLFAFYASDLGRFRFAIITHERKQLGPAAVVK
ncbi:MAG: hypothetical protein HKL96_00570 [Phycisphaerales bacterium]|nr:hypothetical protein [Phycisphaerales bacterium]